MKKLRQLFVYFLGIFLFTFPIESSIVEYLKKKYDIKETKKKNNKSTFGFQQGIAEKKASKFLPFVIRHEGGIQNKKISIGKVHTSKYDSQDRRSEETYSSRDNSEKYNNEEINEIDDELIDEILKSLEGI
jgi:hypothetical protein